MRTNNKTQPTYDAESGNRTSLVGGERSHYCAIPAPQCWQTQVCMCERDINCWQTSCGKVSILANLSAYFFCWNTRDLAYRPENDFNEVSGSLSCEKASLPTYICRVKAG